MTIEKLSESGIEFILSENINFPDGWNKSMIESGVSSGRLKGFILKDDNPVGYILFTMGVDEGEIDLVFVKESERKKGYASLLLKSAIEYIESENNKIFLEVRESNVPARKLYEKFAFKVIAERKCYYNGVETAVIYLREKK